MQLDRRDVELMLAIAAGGSLAAAARRLELAPTVVSKRLSALEARTGSALLQRTTRRCRLTPEGEAFVAWAGRVQDDFDALERALAEQRGQVTGVLRLVSSPGFGRVWLAPAVAALQQAHPGLRVQLHLADTLPDLTAGRFDAAVWLWTPRAGSLVTRRLAPNRRVVVASPAYLARRGRPQSLDDLARHDCLVVRENDDAPAVWRLQRAVGRGGPIQPVRVQGPLSSNHGEVVRDWALAGHGLMLRSWWDVQPLIAEGRLEHVLPAWAMRDADVHLVMPPRDRRLPASARERALVQHLVGTFAQAPWVTALLSSATAPSVAAAPPAAPPTRRRTP